MSHRGALRAWAVAVGAAGGALLWLFSRSALERRGLLYSLGWLPEDRAAGALPSASWSDQFGQAAGWCALLLALVLLIRSFREATS